MIVSRADPELLLRGIEVAGKKVWSVFGHNSITLAMKKNVPNFTIRLKKVRTLQGSTG